MSTTIGRIIPRYGTRQQVECDGSQTDFTVNLYDGQLYYDTTDGHLWVSDGTKQIKIDPRATVSYENEAVFYENELVLY